MELLSQKRKQIDFETQTSAIKQTIIASIICEQAMLLIIDESKRDLRNRCKILISAAKSLQNHFQYHPESSPKYTEIFRREFLSNKNVLFGAILGTLYDLDEETLSHVLDQLRTYVSSAEEVVEETGETLK